MESATSERIAPWIRWSSAIFLAILAASAYFACMSNGIVAGALIGIQGREGDVATAQRNAMYWYAASWSFQIGVVIAIFSLLRFGSDAAPVARYLLRVFVAVLVGFPVTILVGMVLWGALRLLFPHHPIR
jgi:hypothetical protein